MEEKDIEKLMDEPEQIQELKESDFVSYTDNSDSKKPKEVIGFYEKNNIREMLDKYYEEHPEHKVKKM